MANKKAVLTKPTPDASLPRNAFDRESMRTYHYALGQLIPAWYEPVTAGTHMKLNRKIFQRTSDLNTAAFPIMDTHIQYYFVPTRLMWSLWDNFRLGISDIESTGQINIANDMTILGRTTMPSRVPYSDLADMYSQLAAWSTATPPATDVHGDTIEDSGIKLLNLLGYGNPKNWAPTVSGEVNLWPLLAYHKIYYDHFRNTQYENNNPRMYNMDYLWAQNRNMKLPFTELAGLLTLHYVNYRNDYFNNIYPSLNYIQVTSSSGGSGSLAPGSLSSNPLGIPLSIVGAYGTVGTTFHGIYNSGNANGVALSQTLSATPVTSSFNLQTLRTAFAFDKLLRSSAYAPQHVKDQYEARYGIKFKRNNNHSIYIGAFKNDIQIGEVTSTADTGSSGLPLGAIGGKGVSFDDWSKTLEFTADEDGIVMAVQYTTIRSCYGSFGLDSFLRKALPEDYFVPEYQNLGLEAVYGEELALGLGQTTILGYRPRNQRYKLGVDKSYGLFADTNVDMSHFINHTEVGRIPSVGVNGVGYNWFKVNPHDLDGIVSVDYDGTWSTDQFFGQTIFGATMIQNMSVHGQPSL